MPVRLLTSLPPRSNYNISISFNYNVSISFNCNEFNLVPFLRKLTLQSVFGSHKRKNEEIELKATFTLHSPKNNHSEPTNRERYNKLSSALPLYCVNEVRRCNDFIVTPRDRGQPSGHTRVSGRLLELSGEIC